ncbi:MAG: M20 family metallopeptidase [Chloroflexota bacterium]
METELEDLRPRVDSELVTELTRELVRFPSVNPPGNEQPAAEHLARRMRDLGLEAQIQQLEPDRANVIGRLRGRGEGHLVFTGHLDVVPTGEQAWQHDPFGAEMVNGEIYGRGSADMKGGVAAMVGAAAALARAGFKPSGDLIIACTAGEEAGMLGAGYMVEQNSLAGARYLIVGEPSDLQVFIAEKGVLWFEIRASGRTAHGSMPWLGINAVSFLARLASQLEEMSFPFEESKLLGGPTLSVNRIEGGNKTNVVPDTCRVSVDMRTVPSQDHQAILRSIRELAQSTADAAYQGLQFEIGIENDKPPLETDASEPLVRAMIQSVQRVRRTTPHVGGVTYGTDAACLGPGYGIPMVICGPGAPGMAHQPDEHVPVKQVIEAAEIYADVALRLLG